ncbi:MAG: tetratricopeptide repeat protein [Theionarchaea archaeon]|nr:tetratricopeptide repeat protein [Theionarchaea archaeon]
MKKIGIWVVVCVLVLHIGHSEQAYSKTYTDCEWTLEPKTDGSVHVEAEITIGSTSSSYEFSFPKTAPADYMDAWDAETKKRIEVTEKRKGDRIHYTIKFQGTKKAGFRFIVEFEQLKAVEEKDEIYYFAFGWECHSDTSHTATVILPRNHELLHTEYIDPEKVSSRSNRVYATFAEDVLEEESFRLVVVFSEKGVQLCKEAENSFNLGLYKEAKKAYQEAAGFYLQLSLLYGWDMTSFIEDLLGYSKECDNNLAEEKYEEAVAAFTNGDYTAAQVSFIEAQNMFLSAGNSEKEDECQDFIDQCTQLLEQEKIRSEAEELFNEGITLFEQQQYEEAKTKFEEALAKYTELQDEEKIQECQDWISSYEKELKGFCIGSVLIFTTLLGAFLVRALKSCRSGH